MDKTQPILIMVNPDDPKIKLPVGGQLAFIRLSRSINFSKDETVFLGKKLEDYIHKSQFMKNMIDIPVDEKYKKGAVLKFDLPEGQTSLKEPIKCFLFFQDSGLKPPVR